MGNQGIEDYSPREAIIRTRHRPIRLQLHYSCY